MTSNFEAIFIEAIFIGEQRWGAVLRNAIEDSPRKDRLHPNGPHAANFSNFHSHLSLRVIHSQCSRKKIKSSRTLWGWIQEDGRERLLTHHHRFSSLFFIDSSLNLHWFFIGSFWHSFSNLILLRRASSTRSARAQGYFCSGPKTGQSLDSNLESAKFQTLRGM